ncbi:MAG: SDR family oxidoreductase [Bacteroidales bacterium]|nr:SDR family oxidoreductase [Bacteroidales bacterium]MCF8404728.1 SDR family oxidoreductase [Bacteroidales bacterium]
MVTNGDDPNYIFQELSTQPLKEDPLILVTGASGYIGGRLVPELIARGYKVRVMVRKKSPEFYQRWPQAEIAEADATDVNKLNEVLKGVSIAYYLIHSLQLGHKKFESYDLRVAENFRLACEAQKVKRIIYLGGLGKENTKLSPHLNSRIKVAYALSAGQTPVTVLRAGMIIGSGSASYEILKNLVINTPIFIIPRWAKTKSQPISIRAVLLYLIGVAEADTTAGKTFDIGGPDILSYEEKLLVLSRLIGKKRFFIPGFISWPRFYGYVVSLLTYVPAPITRVLIEGCKNEVVCEDAEIQKFVPIELYSFKTSLVKALSTEKLDLVTTRWTDAYPPAHNLSLKLNELEFKTRFMSSYYISSDKPAARIYDSFCQIGGDNGWIQNNWMLRFLAALDKIILGVGTIRGRRSLANLRINDVIDFWRVEDIVQNKSLLLRAETKMPGSAWLEFLVNEGPKHTKFILKAYYQPDGMKGTLYWFNFLPFHNIIFRKLVKQIEKRS